MNSLFISLLLCIFAYIEFAPKYMQLTYHKHIAMNIFIILREEYTSQLSLFTFSVDENNPLATVEKQSELSMQPTGNPHERN